MFQTSQQLHAIAHPNVAGAFSKTDKDNNNILILELYSKPECTGSEDVDSDLLQILADLDDLKKRAEAEQHVIFSRVDIRPN